MKCPAQSTGSEACSTCAFQRMSTAAAAVLIRVSKTAHAVGGAVTVRKEGKRRSEVEKCLKDVMVAKIHHHAHKQRNMTFPSKKKNKISYPKNSLLHLKTNLREPWWISDIIWIYCAEQAGITEGQIGENRSHSSDKRRQNGWVNEAVTLWLNKRDFKKGI